MQEEWRTWQITEDNGGHLFVPIAAKWLLSRAGGGDDDNDDDDADAAA